MAVSRPVVYGGLIVLCIGSYAWLKEEPPKATKPKPHRSSTVKSKSTTPDSEFTEADDNARFGKPKPVSRNLFTPLVQPAPATSTLPAAPTEPPKDLDKIPAEMAGNEPNWIFTGFATVNGVDMALLENTSTKQGGFVKQGELWKTTQIVRITPQSLVMTKKDGTQQVILRFDPNKPPDPKAPGDAGMKPLDPSSALRGPIGQPPMGMPPGFNPGGMQIRPIPMGVTFSN